MSIGTHIEAYEVFVRHEEAPSWEVALEEAKRNAAIAGWRFVKLQSSWTTWTGWGFVLKVEKADHQA